MKMTKNQRENARANVDDSDFAMWHVLNSWYSETHLWVYAVYIWTERLDVTI